MWPGQRCASGGTTGGLEMPAVACQPRGNMRVSLSGKSASGVSRVIDCSPSTPRFTSTRMIEPAVIAWWAAAVAITR